MRLFREVNGPRRAVPGGLLVGAVCLLAIGLHGCGDDGDPSTARQQALRGRYLATAVGDCTGCHSSGKNPDDPMWLAGYTTADAGQPFLIGPFKTYAANLTPDAETGIGKWSADELFNALRTGKDPEGHYLCPPMPWPTFRNMTDDDLHALVAYLRSLKPVHNVVPVSEGPNPHPDGHGDWASAYADLQPLPAYPAATESTPSAGTTASQVQYGRYLVTAVGDCAGCHGGTSPADPNWLAGFKEGTPGQPFQIGPFKTYPANLTPDSETGLGDWSVQDIVNALRHGKDKEGQYLAPPMPWPTFREMSDSDLTAIAAYLKSLKPVHNVVPESEGPNPFPNGHGDWSAAYAHLQPLPAYPAANEIEVR